MFKFEIFLLYINILVDNAPNMGNADPLSETHGLRSIQGTFRCAYFNIEHGINFESFLFIVSVPTLRRLVAITYAARTHNPCRADIDKLDLILGVNSFIAPICCVVAQKRIPDVLITAILRDSLQSLTFLLYP